MINQNTWTGRVYKCVYGLDEGDVFTVTSEPFSTDRRGTKAVDGISSEHGEISMECEELEASIYWERRTCEKYKTNKMEIIYDENEENY